MGDPLDRSATWPYESGKPGRFSYARADHPTGVACEEAVGALDGGHALLYPSGMGAVTTVVLTMLRPGGTIALLLGALSVAVLVGLRIAVAIAGGGVATAHLAAASLHLLAFGLAVGALALALGAGTGQRGLAAGVAAGITLVMYLVNGIAPVSDATSWLRYLTLFHYNEGGDPIANGIDAAGLAVLVLVTMLLLAVAVAAFERRDLRG